MIDIKKIGAKIDEILVKRSSYHKAPILNLLRDQIEKMMSENLSIKEICFVLGEVGVVVTPVSIRGWMKKIFGAKYRDYLERNGWKRKNQAKEVQHVGVQKEVTKPRVTKQETSKGDGQSSPHKVDSNKETRGFDLDKFISMDVDLAEFS